MKKCPVCNKPVNVRPGEENAVITHMACAEEAAREIREKTCRKPKK
jgi:hypothetical protein